MRSSSALLTKREAQETIEFLISEVAELINRQDSGFIEEKKLFEASRKRIVYLKDQIELFKRGERLGIPLQIQEKINRDVISCLFSKRMYGTAEKLASNLGLESICMMERELYRELQGIQDSLRSQSCAKALEWAANHRAGLQKIHSDLEFQLIFQQFIELIKKEKSLEALVYLRSTSKHFQPENYSSIMKAMGCLILGENIGKRNYSQFKEKYEIYFKESRWIQIMEQFNKDYSKIVGIKASSSLEVFLSAGIATFQTPFCSENTESRNESCPTCNKWMQQISANIPATQKSVSTLICRITGEPINENNPAVALPNSEVYSMSVTPSPLHANSLLLSFLLLHPRFGIG